jgi:hypothetical protein
VSPQPCLLVWVPVVCMPCESQVIESEACLVLLSGRSLRRSVLGDEQQHQASLELPVDEQCR